MGSEKEIILGIDLGTSSVKIICVKRNDIVCSASKSYKINPGKNSMPIIETWWQAIVETFHDLARQIDLGSVSAIGLTGSKLRSSEISDNT